VPLDPQVRLVLDNLPPGLLDVRSRSVADLRALYEGQRMPFPAEPVAKVEERALPGPAGAIRVRVYTPEVEGAPPALLYFHGGGWVMCNLDTHDGSVRKLANASGCMVVSVDYRLAPEHPFPAGLEDCYAATRWVAEHARSLGARPGPLAVAGDSAGGNLAAAVALLARERGGPELALQLLVYPITDCDFERPSYRENGEGFLLTRDATAWFWDQYAPDAADRRDPLAAPMAAADLSGLAPACVITAEYDPLRDEAEAYAARLREAGVPVTCTRYDGMIHGFFSYADFVDKGRLAVAQAGAALRAAFTR